MKIRKGFVSNSSSASFICEVCSKEYDVDMRGGVDEDEWKTPKEGLCEACQDEMFICNCGKPFRKSECIEVDEEYSFVGTNLGFFSKHVCPDCFVSDKFEACNEFKEKWALTVANPKHKFTAVDKKIIKALNKKVANTH